MVYGRMQPFVPETEDIGAYLERLSLYFDENDIAKEKRVAVFLTVIGPANYTLLRGLVSPHSPKDKMLTELQDVLKAHFEPKLSLLLRDFGFTGDTKLRAKLLLSL